MKVGIIGGPTTTNFVMALSVAISNLKEEPVVVRSIKNDEYSYLPENVNGVEFSSIEGAIEVWDTEGEIPVTFVESDKVFVVVDGSIVSDNIATILHTSIDVDGVIYLGPEPSSVTKLYSTMFKDKKIYYVPQDYTNLLSLARYGKVRFKTLPAEFLEAISEILTDHFDASPKELKTLWSYLKRRG